MKIVKSEGCTNWYTRVDDIDLDNIPNSNKYEILKKIIHNIPTIYLDEAINNLLDSLEPTESYNYYCEQCNDTQYINTYEL